MAAAKFANQHKQIYGTQHYQAKHHERFKMLKSKYAQATSFLTAHVKRENRSICVTDDIFKKVVGVFFVQQMSANKGFKVFGERALEAMIKDLKQLNDGAVPGKPVVIPIGNDVLTEGDKKRDLDAVNIIKEKRDRRVKGRTCANGSKQRQYLKQYESVASPTVSLESFLTTLLIGVHEGRNFIYFDVPGAFLQSEMAHDKTCFTKVEG